MGIPATGSFYEEVTYWNAQWGTPMGANQTTTIDDMITTAQQVGTGALVSDESYEAMTTPSLMGFGTRETVCEPSCFPQTELYNMGLGVVLSGPWILQDPLLSGVGASEAYLPSEDIAIAVVTTFLPAAFDAQGNYPNFSDYLWREVGAVVAPNDPPPELPPPPPVVLTAPGQTSRPHVRPQCASLMHRELPTPGGSRRRGQRSQDAETGL